MHQSLRTIAFLSAWSIISSIEEFVGKSVFYLHAVVKSCRLWRHFERSAGALQKIAGFENLILSLVGRVIIVLGFKSTGVTKLTGAILCHCGLFVQIQMLNRCRRGLFIQHCRPRCLLFDVVGLDRIHLCLFGGKILKYIRILLTLSVHGLPLPLSNCWFLRLF